MLIGSCNQKVFNEYAFLIEKVKTLTCFLCVKTSTKRQSSPFPTPELTSLAARPHRAAMPSTSAHQPIEVARLLATALPWFFLLQLSRRRRALSFHNQESSISSWPISRAEAFFQIGSFIWKALSCSKH